MKVPVWVVVAVHAVVAVIFIAAIPEHVVDPAWPDHARNHVFQSLFWVVGLCAGAAALAWGPLRRGRRWALWVLVALGLLLFGGYFVPVVATGGGAPGALDDVTFAVLAVADAGALVAAWRSLRGDEGS